MDKTNIVAGISGIIGGACGLTIAAVEGIYTYKYLLSKDGQIEKTLYPERTKLILSSGAICTGAALGLGIVNIIGAVKCFKH